MTGKVICSMESFFLSETTKYLYLLFDPENFINNDGTLSRMIRTPNGNCLIDGNFLLTSAVFQKM